jgi:hypothetical protein
MGPYNRVAAVIMFAALMVLEAHPIAQRETIPQAIARGASGKFATTPSGVPPALDRLLSETELIVRGTLGEPRAVLSDDEYDVLTEYPLHRPTILAYSTTQNLRTASPPITVTQRGGTIVINGVTFTQTEDALAPLRPGTDGLFLLKRKNSRYVLAGIYFGAFDASGSTLVPLVNKPEFAAGIGSEPVDHAIGHLVARFKAVRVEAPDRP